MYSGVAYSEDYLDPTSGVSTTEYASGWKQPPTDAGKDHIPFPTTIHEQILTMNTLEATHGARWKYRSIESEVLAWCLESVTGKPLADVVSTEIWEVRVSHVYDTKTYTTTY
jgi:CubicO group peptidase (beta-lactamase class C family)